MQWCKTESYAITLAPDIKPYLVEKSLKAIASRYIYTLVYYTSDRVWIAVSCDQRSAISRV